MNSWNDTIQLILKILSSPILSGVSSVCSLIAILLAIFRFLSRRNAEQGHIELVVREVIHQLKTEQSEARSSLLVLSPSHSTISNTNRDSIKQFFVALACTFLLGAGMLHPIAVADPIRNTTRKEYTISIDY